LGIGFLALALGHYLGMVGAYGRSMIESSTGREVTTVMVLSAQDPCSNLVFHGGSFPHFAFDMSHFP
jgi:hypothetical protein